MNRLFSVNVVWTTASSLIENITGILTFFIVARIIGSEAFGIAAMAFAFLFVGEFLVRDTITEAIIERKELEDGRLEGTFFALALLSVTIAGLLAILAPAIAALYGQPEVTKLLQYGSPVILIYGLSGVSSAILRRRLAFRTLAVRDAVAVVAGGIVCVLLALGGFGAWSLIAQRLVQLGTSAVISVVAAGWLPTRIARKADFALVRGLGPNVVVLRTTSLVITQTPTVVLGLFAGPAAVGLYAFGFRLIELLTTLVIFPLRTVAQPTFAELRRQTGRAADFFLDVTQMAALLGFTAFAGLAVISEPAVILVMGTEWSGAAAIMPYLCVLGASNALVWIQESYVLAIDKLPKFLVAAAIELGLGLVLVGFAGPLGLTFVAFAVAARAVIATPIRTLACVSHEKIPLVRYASTLLRPLGIASGMSVAVLTWTFALEGKLGALYLVTTSILVGCFVFLVLLVLAMPDTVARLRALFPQKDV